MVAIVLISNSPAFLVAALGLAEPDEEPEGFDPADDDVLTKETDIELGVKVDGGVLLRHDWANDSASVCEGGAAELMVALPLKVHCHMQEHELKVTHTTKCERTHSERISVNGLVQR